MKPRLSPKPHHEIPAAGTDSLTQRLQRRFRDVVKPSSSSEPHLAAALHDVLAHPGSLFRAGLACRTGEVLGFRCGEAEELAVAIEYFHTASLILDDLPCMDDAEMRRGAACVHRKFGDATAILTALGLINRAYVIIMSIRPSSAGHRSGHVAGLLDATLGFGGILNGQAYDLACSGQEASKEQVTAIAIGKTVSLLRLTLMLPAILAEGGAYERFKLEQLALYWGIAYQGIDDLKDQLLSASRAGKSTGRDAALGRPNLLEAAGWEESMQAISDVLESARRSIDALCEISGHWSFLRDFQEKLEHRWKRLPARMVAA